MIKKILLLLMGVITFFSAHTMIVSAATVNNKFTSSFIGTYHYVDSSGKFGDFEIFNRIGDNTVSYCIEPGVSLYNGTYTGYYGLSTEELASKVNLTPNQLIKVSQLAYYGYGYNNSHIGNEWLVATQALIWQELGRSFQFTSRNYAADPDRYVIPTPVEVQAAMNEIQNLVNNHYRTPAFQTNSAKIALGESFVFQDQIGYLSNFYIKNCFNCNASISGNNLTVTPSGEQNGYIQLSKNNNFWSRDFVVYHSDYGQDLLIPGNLDPINFQVNFTVISGSLTIKKYDADNKSCQPKPNGELKGAKYNLYKENGEFVTQLVIGGDCSASVGNLELGKYYFQEVEPGKNYELDVNKYNIELTENNSKITEVVYDKMYLGEVSIKKYDLENGSCNPQGKAKLAGTSYGVYKENGELVTELVIDENCQARTERTLLLGKYYIQEITPGLGYRLDKNKYPFEITKDNAEETVEILLTDKVYDTELTINKNYLEANGIDVKPEVGATFEVWSTTKNQKVATLVIDESGTASVKLPYDDYIIKQVLGKEHYILSNDIHLSVNETTDEKTYISLLNKPFESNLKIVKIDAESKKQIAYEGVTFKIKNLSTNEYVCQKVLYPEAKEICEFSTNKDGELTLPEKLIAGDYELEEIDAPPGYLLSNYKLVFSINEETAKPDNEGLISVVTFENQPIKGEIVIEKTGEAFTIEDAKYFYNEIKLSGVEFSLYADEDIITPDNVVHYKKGELIKSIQTTNDGTATFSDLYLGKYVVKETKTLDNYVVDTTEHKIELTEVDNKTAVVSETLKLKNKLKKGGLEFTKTDLTNGEPIPNTVIEIYVADTDELIFTGETDENGQIIITDLVAGKKYYILEKESATGYVITDEKVTFEITEDGEVIKAEMKNKPITGTLEFTKVDLSTGMPLPETLIEVYLADTDELVFSGRTDNNGMIVIENLRYGRYYLLEKEAPNDYILNEERMYFEILEDKEVVKATMENEKVEVPNTGINDYHIIEIISVLAIICGIGMMIYAKKKNKK